MLKFETVVRGLTSLLEAPRIDESARNALKSVEYQRSLLPDFDQFCEPVWYFFSEVQLVSWPGRGRDQIVREIAAKVAHGWPE